MRKLASIRKIKEILPIPDADKICVYVVDDWHIVDTVGRYTLGELVVYFEIDSYLPTKPEFEFLRARSFKRMGDKEGFRLRTIRLRGQVSQGLILPLSILGEKHEIFSIGEGCIGADVSEELGIEKYEAPVPAELNGQVKGNFPTFIKKTDQERCLSGDTIVDTENGKIRIQDICEQKLHIKVWTYNHITEQLELKPITAHSILTRSKDWYKITLKSGKTITCTGNHMIWCNDIEAYRRVDEILCGQIFITKTV